LDEKDGNQRYGSSAQFADCAQEKKVCTRSELAEALRGDELPVAEARSWRKDLRGGERPSEVMGEMAIIIARLTFAKGGGGQFPWRSQSGVDAAAVHIGDCAQGLSIWRIAW